MSYIIMAIQEEGSEIRISDFDINSSGFPTTEMAYQAVDLAREYYPEYRQIWVEELQDSSYWMERIAREGFESPDYWD